MPNLTQLKMPTCFVSMLHDSDRCCFLLWTGICVTSPERSLNQMMDTASEVMPPLPWHNKGFGWWLSPRDGCRGCCSNPMHLKPSYAHSSHPHHDVVKGLKWWWGGRWRTLRVHEMRYARGLPHSNLILAPPESVNILAGPRSDGRAFS